MTATQPHAPATSDADLLRRYASTRSPDAFAALVDRYLPLIYSAAVRQTRDPHVAEDVAQATLLLLSERVSRIDPAVLPGWLMKAAHYAARNAVRQRNRRVAHEHRAATMRPESIASSAAGADAVSDVIDPALARLGDADRTAVVLRYMQDKSFADIAAHLRTTEAAAQRRVSRALEKLRTILAGRGVAISPAALPAALASQAMHPIPATLASHAASLASLKTPSTVLLTKGASYAMAATKLNVAAAIAAVLLVGAVVPTAYHYAAARSEPLIPSPPSRAASSSITPLPPLPAGTDMSVPVAGSLPKGITAEPLAMMNLSDKRLMRPTGGELTDRPEYLRQLFSNASRLTVVGATHALLFRITRADPSPISWTFSISGSDHYGSTGTYDANTHSSYMMVVFAPSRGADTITLTVDAGDGPWTNTAVIPASATVPTKVSVDGVTLVFDPPAEQDKQTRVKVPMDRIPGGMCREFYAVDSAGQKDCYPGTTLDRDGNYVYTFPGRLSSYKEFRLDSRPYTYHATYAAIPLAQAKQ